MCVQNRDVMEGLAKRLAFWWESGQVIFSWDGKKETGGNRATLQKLPPC